MKSVDEGPDGRVTREIEISENEYEMFLALLLENDVLYSTIETLQMELGRRTNQPTKEEKAIFEKRQEYLMQMYKELRESDRLAWEDNWG